MSNVLKISIVIVLIMFGSTGYWLYTIDVQEQTLTTYKVQASNKSLVSSHWDRELYALMGAPQGNISKPTHEVTYGEYLFAQQKITASYRYMIGIDVFLIICLIINLKYKRA